MATPVQPAGLDEKQAGALVGLTPGAMRQLRFKDRGPRYVKLGKRVLYRPTDLDQWLADHLVEPGATTAKGTAANG